MNAFVIGPFRLMHLLALGLLKAMGIVSLPGCGRPVRRLSRIVYMSSLDASWVLVCRWPAWLRPTIVTVAIEGWQLKIRLRFALRQELLFVYVPDETAVE